MKLISVTSNGDRLARIAQLYDESPDFVGFVGKTLRVNVFGHVSMSTGAIFNGDLQSALKAAEEWLKGAQV